MSIHRRSYDGDLPQQRKMNNPTNLYQNMGRVAPVIPAYFATYPRNGNRKDQGYATQQPAAIVPPTAIMSCQTDRGNSGSANTMAASVTPLRGMTLREAKDVLLFAQDEANLKGLGRPITMREFLEIVGELEGFDHTKHPFKNLASTIGRFRSIDWSELPAFEFLCSDDDEDDKVADEIESAQRSYIPMPMRVAVPQQNAMMAKSAFTAPSEHPRDHFESVFHAMAPTRFKEISQMVSHKRFEASRQRQGIDAVNSSQALAGLQISVGYKGDITGFHRRNRYCTEAENSCVRVENINPNATSAEIFEQIREGAVFSYSRNPPMLPRHPYAAANVMFKTAQAAQAFIHRGKTQGIRIRGGMVRVFANRNMCQELANEIGDQSRVLLIYGPAYKISAASVVKYLKQFVTFDPVEFFQSSPDEYGQILVTIVFESVYGQSRQAKLCFEKTWLKTESGVNRNQDCCISYGRDPCEPSMQYGGEVIIYGASTPLDKTVFN